MNEHSMGGYSSDRAEPWRMLADLQDRNAEQGDFAVLAEKIEGMFADPEVIKKAAFVGYHLGVRAHRELGDRAADVDPETVAGMLKDVLLELQDTVLRLVSQDELNELNQLNGRVVRQGEQPGEANF